MKVKQGEARVKEEMMNIYEKHNYFLSYFSTSPHPHPRVRVYMRPPGEEREVSIG